MNLNINKTTRVISLGTIGYEDALAFQVKLFQEILDLKSANRVLPATEQKATPNYLIFCEHPNVYTLGRNGEANNLLVGQEKLSSIGATFFETNRGGDITYHGPGQIVGYPIIDLENFFTDIHQYMRFLEESIIQTVREFAIEAGRIPGLTGVWCDFDSEHSARKIAALGVKTSRWVTMHGLALNVNTDLSYFDNIIACGIPDKAVTSLQKETGEQQDVERVRKMLAEKIGNLFAMDLVYENASAK